jgi:hypothetical protein
MWLGGACFRPRHVCAGRVGARGRGSAVAARRRGARRRDGGRRGRCARRRYWPVRDLLGFGDAAQAAMRARGRPRGRAIAWTAGERPRPDPHRALAGLGQVQRAQAARLLLLEPVFAAARRLLLHRAAALATTPAGAPAEGPGGGRVYRAGSGVAWRAAGGLARAQCGPARCPRHGFRGARTAGAGGRAGADARRRAAPPGPPRPQPLCFALEPRVSAAPPSVST